MMSTPSRARATGASCPDAQDLPLVHPTYLRLLVDGARAEDVRLGPRLAALGLDPDALCRRDEPVPLVAWRRVLLALQRSARRPGLAIRLGQRVPLLAHGPLAYLMVSARDLREALQALVRFAPLRLAVLDLTLHEHPHAVELHAAPRLSLGDVEHVTLDFLWAMLGTMLDELKPGARRAMHLRLAGAGADTAAVWAAHGVAAATSAAGSFLVLPRTLVDAPLPTASAREFQRAWLACEAAEREQGWAKSISAQIEQLFRTGSAASYGLGWVAGQLGLSRRTVMRRLDEEGKPFSVLVEASRKQRLRRRLQERQLALGEIAVDLGYADGSALNRAVKRWYGMSPSELQRRLTEGRDAASAGLGDRGTKGQVAGTE